jgi:hypothetical protein|tara:strand:- start:135 stop:410 length:276 start_codon:yes stop_codon:yes gene_type:complete
MVIIECLDCERRVKVDSDWNESAVCEKCWGRSGFEDIKDIPGGEEEDPDESEDEEMKEINQEMHTMRLNQSSLPEFKQEEKLDIFAKSRFD